MKEKADIALSDKNLLSILDIEGNNICNDCEIKDPLWCSINNAVLLCTSCARIHKKFNQNISKIKSLEIDIWTEQEINFLKLGGNKRFTELIKSYNIPLTKENQEYKYYTKAAQYYRDILIEESKNNNINSIIKPSLKEGIEILYKDEYSNLFNKYKSQQNDDINNNNTNNNDSWVNKIIGKIKPNIGDSSNNMNNNNENNENKAKNFFGNITNNMLNAFSEVSEKAKDIDFVEKFRQAGQYVHNKTEIIQNSDTFKGFMNSFSTGIDNIIQKTDKFFKPEQNKIDSNNKVIIINEQNSPLQNNIDNNNDTKTNLSNEKNNNQNNLKINNSSGIIENIVNKITEPRFKSNYSSINNDKNDQYDNYINEISENTAENKNEIKENNNERNIVENKEEKIDENNLEEKKENNINENIATLQNYENDINPNLLIMNNAPK